MKKMVIGLLMAAMAVPAAPAMAQRDRSWSDHQRDEDARANRGDHRGQYHEQSGRRDNGRHLGWGRNRGHNYHWRRGQQMGYNDWNSSRRVEYRDYRRYNLRQPPRGYEWRRNDDRYILGAVTSGLIISVILRSGR